IEAWQRGDARRAARAARARAAAAAGLSAARVLAGCAEGEPTGSAPARPAPGAADQVGCLAAFLRGIERADVPGRTERFGRARAAVLAVLDNLAAALGRAGHGRRALDELAALIYHALESQTFAPAPSRHGVHLVDAASARFGEFDDVFLVGLV